MTRTLGIAGTAAALIGLPFVILLATPKPESPPPTNEATGALTVRVDTDPYLLKVNAVGPPPDPSVIASLASEDGKRTARAAAVDPAKCTEDARAIALETQDDVTAWCLSITGLPEYGTMTGAISSSGAEANTELALTVQRRLPILAPDSRPLWELVLGLLAGVLLAVLVPLLATGVRGARLAQMLAVNDRRSTQAILGLREWVKARQEDGSITQDDLIAKVGAVMHDGQAKSLVARALLREALAGTTLGDHPMVDVADAEVRSTENWVDDFYASDGTSVVHPAAALESALARMEDLQGRIEQMENELSSDPSLDVPEVRSARAAWSRARVPGDVDSVEEATNLARYALDGKQGIRRANNPQAVQAQELSPQELRAAGWNAVVGALALTTVLSILIAVAFAATTVYTATYLAKPDFGGWTDEFGLFSAALGSGVAATVLGLLAPWGVSIPDE